MKIFNALLLTAGIMISPISNANSVECIHTMVSYTGTTNTESICKSVNKVTSYFDDLGYSTVPHINIKFLEKVYSTFLNQDNSKQSRIQVFAEADANNFSITSTDFESPSRYHRDVFGMEFNSKVASSILSHEIVHLQVAHILGDNYNKLTRSWHENLAYSVQIHLMPTQMRNKILKNIEAWIPQNDMQVHALSYGKQPDAFAVGSYEYALQKGGVNRNLTRVLNSEHTQIDISHF